MGKLLNLFDMDPHMHLLDMKVFGVQWFLWFAFFIMLTVFLSRLAVKKGREFAKKLLFWIMVGTFIFYWWYKLVIVYTPGCSVVMAENGKAPNTIWNELPLHLCNINMILIPLGIKTERKSILGFSLYMAPLGAFMALISPTVGFSGYSIFLPRVFGYFLTHFIILFAGIWINTFGIYKPSLKDIPKTILAMLIIYTITFGINEVFRVLHLYDNANFFYSFSHDNIGALKIFWNFIPFPYLYLLPAIVILVVYLFAYAGIQTLVTNIIEKKKNEETPYVANEC